MVQTRSGGSRNLWRKRQSGLYAPSKLNFPIDGLVLYAPLWHPEKSGTSFNAWDVANETVHSCSVIGAVWGIQGRTFDGIDDVIDCGGILDTVPSAIGIMGWYKPSDSAHQYHTLFHKDNIASQDRLWANYDKTNNVFQLTWEENNNGTHSLASLGSKVPDTWYHIAMTWDTTNGTRLYVDGVLEDDDNTATTLMRDGTADKFLISYAAAEQYKGLIGEFLLYNRTLSLEEINQHRNSTKWRYS